MFLFGPSLVVVIIISIVFGIAAAGAVILICIKKGVISKDGNTADAAPKTSKNPIVAAISENKQAFTGLYEPLYCCAKSKKYTKKAAVFEAWSATAAEIGKDNIAFSNAYNKAFGNFAKWKKKKFRKKAKKLLKLVKRAGIKRDKNVSVVFDDVTFNRYDFAGVAELTQGELLEVLAPFWYSENEILQKGIVR